MDRKMSEQEIIASFEKAINNREFFVVYQPQINHSSGSMIGAEALVRWRHGENGLQYPAEFIPVFERNNLISRLDMYVVEEVCRFQRKCLDEYKTIVPVAVNISRQDVEVDEFIDKIDGIRGKYNVPVKYLRVEMDEAATEEGMRLAKEALEKLHEREYIIGINKFGSGYSSLNILRELEVDVLKLDIKSFGENIGGRTGVIIDSLVKMARWLETPIIAQGVESVQQADYLRSVGCEYIQGDLYSKPLMEDEFVKKIVELQHEPVIASMQFVKEMDENRFFDPDSVETMVFNYYVGGAAVFSYTDGMVEILRVNRKYIEEIGMNITEKELMMSNPWDSFDEDNRSIYENAIMKSIETKNEQVCETWRSVFSKCCGEDNICVRSTIKLIGQSGQQYIFYASIQNVTLEKNRMNEVSKSDTRFRFAAEQINVYAWEYDVATKEMRPCFRCMRDLGLPALLKNYPEPVIENGIFPQDYADMYREWHKKIEQGEEYLEAIIPLTPDRVPFHVRYTTEFDENGAPVKAYGSATLVIEDEERETAINDKKKAEAALEKALIEAERANAAKTTFLSKMSHDIRTPLNGIIGLLEMDERHPDDLEMIKENRKKTKIAADHLLSLINDVLELSKMEDSNVTLAHEAFNINELTEEALVMAEMRAGESGVTLVKTDYGDRIKFPYVYGSPLHVRQILLNILGNSVKYNVTGGSIEFSMDIVSYSENKVVYKYIIADTGIGMSEEFLQHIYEPFTQAKQDARSVYQGTGLGMPIVKALVDKMNGEIDIKSKEGVGTTFTVIIPFDVAEGNDVVKNEEEEVADIKGAKLLLVEDNELNMDIASFLLEDAGAVVTKATDGQQAVEMFKENPPGTFDAILMDVMMPVLDGLCATRTIRALSRKDARNIPIIAMTANAFAEDKTETKKAGMDDHIAKPLKGNDVIRTISKYL